MTQRDPNARDRDLADLSPAEFRRQLTGGGLRWVATVLAVLSPVALALVLADEEWRAYVPIPISGPAAVWIVAGATVVWGVLAVVNWRNWLRRRGGSSSVGSA